MLSALRRCLIDETGSEVVEYALLLGLLVLGCIVLLNALGLKVTARWRRVLDLL
jgi:Flp pilus assembly pilin Flp